MKKLTIGACLMLVSLSAFCTADSTKKEMPLKEYFLVLLKKGPNRAQDSVTAQKIQAGHMANMDKMHKDGKLCIAGPIGDKNADLRGIFILTVKTKEEAVKLLKEDPAISSGTKFIPGGHCLVQACLSLIGFSRDLLCLEPEQPVLRFLFIGK
jgi:uncharacterized protein